MSIHLSTLNNRSNGKRYATVYQFEIQTLPQNPSTLHPRNESNSKETHKTGRNCNIWHVIIPWQSFSETKTMPNAAKQQNVKVTTFGDVIASAWRQISTTWRPAPELQLGLVG